MKADRPCFKFLPHPDEPKRCYWCKWDEVPHLVPEGDAFEIHYWDTLYGMKEED